MQSVEAAAEIKHLKHCYGERTVLDLPALRLEKGLRYAVIGANGSGKSTLLRILAGVISPSEGTVDTGGQSLAFMPQKPYAFDLSVLKNVELAVRDKSRSKANAEKALKAVGLHDMHSCRGSRLSGGETQRMALARVLADSRQLVLLDEPTAAMDISISGQIEAALSDYVRSSGCTLVFSTHMPSQAAALADKVLLLCGGQLAELGDAQRVLSCPESDYGKEFLSHWRL